MYKSVHRIVYTVLLCVVYFIYFSYRTFTYDSWTLQLTSQNNKQRVISTFHRNTKNILPKQISFQGL